MNGHTITVHEREEPGPPEYPLLYTATGEPVVENVRAKVIGFQGKVVDEEAHQARS